MVILGLLLYIIIQIYGWSFLRRRLASYSLIILINGIIGNAIFALFIELFGTGFAGLALIYSIGFSVIIFSVMFIRDLSLYFKQKGVHRYKMKTLGRLILFVLIVAGYSLISDDIRGAGKYLLMLLLSVILFVTLQIKRDKDDIIKQNSDAQERILKRKETYLEIKKSMGELVREILLSIPGMFNTIKLKVVDSFQKGLVIKEKNKNRTPEYIILMKSIKIHTAILFFLQVLVLFICISADMFLAGDRGIGFISLAGVLLFMNIGIVYWFYSIECEKYLIKIKKKLPIFIFLHIMLVFITMNMAALAASSN